ncbi:SDR family NAD(P)-dependent oxidoreductase [Sulfitobacter sp. M368]|uniref:SDR family NAD(P)-dependent oxidoreductase n=1 Tax=Sulfitobacter sp. M368 TaxID=2867021 RepID=UPI0021A472FF|nr:SDR family oxidoreductase [Sulfitobacter sp. M368]UWR14135.1 SDR family oxidoreductase [Sulfitobacter sp. M368]
MVNLSGAVGDPAPSLTGKSVMITGGGSGIGAALTLGFLSAGAKVTFVQNQDGIGFCDQAEQETGTRPHYIECDLTDVPALKRAMEQTREIQGPLSVLINNAANDQRHSTEDVTEAFWDWSQSINLKAQFFACQAAIADMRGLGGGTIINVSSISYMMGNAGYPAYVAAKAGIAGMTRSLAREFGADNIRINTLIPGWVMTERQKALWATEDAVAAHMERQALKQVLMPQDMVGPALFLASDMSFGMTGQALVIDGGVVATG